MSSEESSYSFTAFMAYTDENDDNASPIPLLAMDHDPGTNARSARCQVTITYITEGAANVIWALRPTIPAEEIPPVLVSAVQSRLLRLRKGIVSPSGAGSTPKPPPYVPTVDVHEYYHNTIAPLFEPHQIIQQALVRVRPDVATRCNEVLDGLEAAGVRHKKRHGWHIDANDPYGLLITSMYPSPPQTVLLHMKPKWLVQSPTAPMGARRCRTCALQAERGPRATHAACPLALISEDRDLIQNHVARLNVARSVGEQDKSLPAALTTSFLPGGLVHPILLRLRDLQRKLDTRGVHNLFSLRSDVSSIAQSPGTTDKDINDLAMAMTLRDTTMFIRITHNENEIGNIEVRLADLDPKKSEPEKVRYWWEIEDKLIRDGWYTGHEKKAGGERQHDSCHLWLGDR